MVWTIVNQGNPPGPPDLPPGFYHSQAGAQAAIAQMQPGPGSKLVAIEVGQPPPAPTDTGEPV